MYRRRSGLSGRVSDVSVSTPATVSCPNNANCQVPALNLAGGAAGLNPNITGANSGAGLVDTRTPQVSVSTPASTPVAPVINVTPPVVVTAAPATSSNWFTDSMFLGIPNWILVAGGGAFLLFGTGGHH